MNPILIVAILASATAPAPSALPPPMTPDQARQVQCVAALAIVASEQQRGVGDWNRLPSLRARGAHFAGVIGEALTGEGGRTREAVREAILAAVARFQKSGVTTLPVETVTNCIALMDTLDPALPPPDLTQCAALLALAAKDVQKREGLSATAKTLITFAAVLDSRARDALRAAGKSEAENDIIIGLAKEDMLATAKVKTRDGVGPDMAACLELAKP